MTTPIDDLLAAQEAEHGEARKIADAVTSGPMVHRPGPDAGTSTNLDAIVGSLATDEWFIHVRCQEQRYPGLADRDVVRRERDANARFIAESFAIVPRLLDDCARLRAALRVMVGQRNACHNETCSSEACMKEPDAAILATLRGGVT